MVENAGRAGNDAPGLTIGQVAARSGLPARRVQHAIQAGELPAHEAIGRSGRQYVVRQDDLDRYLASARLTPRRPGVRRLLANAAWRRTRGRLTPLTMAVLCAELAVLLLLAAIVHGLGPGESHVGAPATATAPRQATPPRQATATPLTAGAVPHCAGSTCHPGSPGAVPIKSSATTSSSFTVVLTRRGDGAPITIRGQMLLHENLVSRIKELYLDCGGAQAARGTPAIQNTVHIDATVSLPAATVARLQRWAASYGALIGADDPRVTDVVTDDPHENAENDGGALWRELRAALGPHYVVRALHTQHDNALQVQPQDQCPARGHAAGTPTNGTRVPRATPSRRAVPRASRSSQSGHAIWRGSSAGCLSADRSLAVQLREVPRGTADPTTLGMAIARQNRACASNAVVPPPAVLAHDRAVWQAYRAAVAATTAVAETAAVRGAIMSGNTNAHDVMQVVRTLDRAVSAYAAYTRIVTARLPGSAARR